MARVYLTQEEYRSYTGNPEAEVSDMNLARASRAVDEALLSAVYLTDGDGYPSDPSVRELLRVATAEQVYAMMQEESAAAAATSTPLGGRLYSATIDGVTWTAAGASTGPSSLPADAGLCAQAWLVLSSVPRSVTAYG